MDKTLNYLNFEIYNGLKILKIFDYNSICKNKIKVYLNSLPSNYFKYLKVEQGAKIEKLCFDYYKNTNYYDIILILNNRDMIYDMPYEKSSWVNEHEMGRRHAQTVLGDKVETSYYECLEYSDIEKTSSITSKSYF